jgi:hypothetical protein
MRGRGRIERPAFPAPSETSDALLTVKTRAGMRGEIAELCVSLFEIEPNARRPGQASERERRSGTHNHRRERLGESR